MNSSPDETAPSGLRHDWKWLQILSLLLQRWEANSCVISEKETNTSTHCSIDWMIRGRRRQRWWWPTINLYVCVFDNIMKEHAYLCFLYTSEGLVLKQNQENEKRRCRGQEQQTLFFGHSKCKHRWWWWWSSSSWWTMTKLSKANGTKRTDPEKARSWLHLIEHRWRESNSSLPFPD